MAPSRRAVVAQLAALAALPLARGDSRPVDPLDGADGMPALNVSFVGLPVDDARLLALAHAFEQAR